MENVLKELGMETEMRFKIKGKCALFFFSAEIKHRSYKYFTTESHIWPKVVFRRKKKIAGTL